MRALSPALFCALLLVTAARGEDPGIQPHDPLTAEETEIKVCVDLAAAVKFQILAGAERTAVELFAGIGVHLRFVCEHNPDASRREIIVRLGENTDPALLKGALGFARPYAPEGVRVTIFYDRVEELQRGRDYTGIILGHTLAHELAHVLEAEETHADDGIMRSRWDEHDVQTMLLRELYFSESDVKAIHSNIGAFLRP